MANKEHLAQLSQGVAAWNAWRLTGDGMGGPDLSGADLYALNLYRADLYGVDLTRADLTKTDLRGANFGGADLGGSNCTAAQFNAANFYHTNLSGANLFEAKLCGALLLNTRFDWGNFRKTDFGMAFLSGVELEGADFHEAIVGRTTFSNVDLRLIQGLETVIHEAPSTIGIDTLYRSNGQIPEVFLRGTGVPDDMITYMKSLVGRPVEFYSCFISYSSKDQEFAERLYNDLQDKNVRCWFAPHDIQGGRKIHEQIDEAIRLHERLLLILSTHSMQSEWVKTEIGKARQREDREKRQVLFPMRLVSFEAIGDWECFDADRGKDSAREIREYFIPDFSNWKNHAAYQQAFQRLLRDLKAQI